MKSKQAIFEQIISSSIKKVRDHIMGGALEEFEQRMKMTPTKNKQLNADPYMFIFELLLSQRECVEYVLTQYQVMIDENFLSTDRNAADLAKQFHRHLEDHSYKIIQLLMKIRNPHPLIFEVYFTAHNSIPMPENILENFQRVGYQWLSRAFEFKKYETPTFVEEFSGKVLRLEDKGLPTVEDEKLSLQKYIKKIVDNMTLQAEDILCGDSEKRSKFGFCFMCEKRADFYCKDTKIPVCGSECKRAHINYIFNNSFLDFRYSNEFRSCLEGILLNNLRLKRNLALSVDFLCAIYLHSSYYPQHPFPHYQLLNSPIIHERIWLVYALYHYKKQQIFEEVFIDGLSTTSPMLRSVVEGYFMRICQGQGRRLIDIYREVDMKGRRVFPALLHKLQPESKVKLVYSLVNIVFAEGTNHQLVKSYEKTNVRLLRAFNHDKDPIQAFSSVYEENWLEKYVQFALNNEAEINKGRFCEVLMKDNCYCKQFLKMIIKRKQSAPLDEIIRQIFYFVNVKVADKIYNLIEIFCEIYETPDIFSTKDSFFQFIYFIIMIVTELHNKELISKTTFPVYLDRVKNFDVKLAENSVQFLKEVYERLNNQPFSQETRGILSYYSPIPLSPSPFHPISCILDNWETIYEVIAESNAPTSILYRCCSLLISNPVLCQPFLQLLLQHINPEQIFTEEHIIPSITSIILEQPNAVGNWKQVFVVDLNRKEHWFQLGSLMHCSKELNDGGFVAFVRSFVESCGMGIVRIHGIFPDVLKMMNYNRERVSLVLRELIQLFVNETNIYYQLDFLSQVFHAGFFQFATQLLNTVSNYIVAEPFIVNLLIHIIDNLHDKLPDKVWLHLLQRVLMLQDTGLQNVFSDCLQKHAACERYYEEFNIKRAISLPFSHSTHHLNPQLVSKLHRFQYHIPQMPTKILLQFLNSQNHESIIRHFMYFCKLDQAYKYLLQRGCQESEYESILIAIEAKLPQNHHILKMENFAAFLAKALFCVEQETVMIGWLEILSKMVQIDDEEDFVKKGKVIYAFLKIAVKECSHVKQLKLINELIMYGKIILQWCKDFNKDIKKRQSLASSLPFKKLAELPSLYKQQYLCTLLLFQIKSHQVDKNNMNEGLLEQIRSYLDELVKDFCYLKEKYLITGEHKKKNRKIELIQLNRQVGQRIDNLEAFYPVVEKVLEDETISRDRKNQLITPLSRILALGMHNYNSSTAQFNPPYQSNNPTLSLIQHLLAH